MPLPKNKTPNPERELMIKTKACRRLIKEVVYYENEALENEEKLAEMKANNSDPYDIRKFEEVLGESYMMIPDSTARLKQSLQDLDAYVGSNEVTEEVRSNEWYLQATKLLENERSRYEEGKEEVAETNVDDLQDGEAF